jgi:WD40 repeat protein
VAWSPTHPAVFATICTSGSLFLWNLSKSTSEPWESLSLRGGRGALNKLTWSRDGRLLLVGDCAGSVCVVALSTPIVPEGGDCVPGSEVVVCADPAVCMDVDGQGTYLCSVSTTIEEGGVCVPGDAVNVCIEGASCVDLDGDETANCTTPSAEFAACPPAYGEVAVIDTAAAAPWMIDVDTSMGVHHTNGTCGNGGDANDVALSFTAPADGDYVAQMVGNFDTVLYAREYCGFSDNLACNDDSEIGGSQIFLTLTAGQTIYLIADGFNERASGVATITVEPAAVIQ